MAKNYDLLIIGTGTAAMVAAMRVRAAGWSVAVVDFRPFGGTCAVPGATITYTILAEVTGSGSISDLVVTDAAPADTSYVAGSLTLDGATLTDAADGDSGTASASGISVDLGNVSAGTSHSITFDVTID